MVRLDKALLLQEGAKRLGCKRRSLPGWSQHIMGVAVAESWLASRLSRVSQEVGVLAEKPRPLVEQRVVTNSPFG